MKVTANLPSAIKPQNRAMVAPTQAPKNGKDGFADLLRGAKGDGGADPLLPDLVVEAGNHRFMVETHIGENAVRFDARPIVAPTGGPMVPDQAEGNGTAVRNDEALAAAVPTAAELLELVGHLAQRLPAIVDRLTERPGPAAPPAIAAAPPGRAGLIASDAAAMRPSPGGRESLPLTVKLPEGTVVAKPSAPLLPPHMNAFAARVAALPREIVVVLRGVTLSAEERESLIDAVRRELVPLRLGERTIRIMGAEGKA